MTNHQKWIAAAEPFTAAQAHADGLTDADLRRLKNSGHVVQVRRNVYVGGDLFRAAAADPAMRHALEVRVVMTALASKRKLVGAGTSAARILGLDLFNPPSPRVVLATDDPDAYGVVRDGYALRVASLPSQDVWRHHNTLVTSPERTLLDLSVELPFIDGVTAADSGLRQELITAPGMDQYLKRIESRVGVREARRIMEFADGRSESALESGARVHYHLNKIRPPLLQVYLLAGIRVDFLWPWFWTVGEGDGLAKYLLGGPPTFRRTVEEERARQQAVEDLGYVFFRFGWDDLHDVPQFIARLRATFEEGLRRNAGRPIPWPRSEAS